MAINNPNSKIYKELKEAFDFFDKDKTGKINTKEIKSVFNQLGKNVTDTNVEDIMSTVDKDCNNTIEFDEFVALVGPSKKTGMNQTEEEELMEQFKTFD